jgi:hypothetical protein
MIDKSNKWLRILPFIVATIIIITIQYIHTLSNERNTNSSPWSRSIDLQLQGGNKEPVIVRERDGENHYLYTLGEQQLHSIKIDLNLTIQHQEAISVPISDLDQYWTNGNDILFIKDHVLFHQTSSAKPKQILEEVQFLKANEHVALVSFSGGVSLIDLEDFTPNIITTKAAKDISLSPKGNSFIIVTEVEPGLLHFTFYKLIENKFISYFLFEKDSYFENYGGIDYVEDEGNVQLFFNTSSRRGGGAITNRNYYAEFNLAQLPKEIIFSSNLQIKDVQTKQRLDRIKNFNLLADGGELKLLFSSYGYVNGTKASNVYIATKNNDSWEAKRVGTTYLPSFKPSWVSSEQIVWLDYDVSAKTYKVMGASTTPLAVEKSLALTKDDYMMALSRTLLSLSGALIFLLVSLLVVIPSALSLVAMHIFNIYNRLLVKRFAITAYFVTQFIFVQRFFDSPSLMNGPFYINFNYSQWFLPIITSCLTLAVTFLVRNPDWNEENEVSYIIGFHMLLMVLMVGPYVF